MNEKIRKLADTVANIMPAGVYNIQYDSGKSGVEFTEDALEKFAELIVAAVISKAEDYGLGCDAVEQLKKDFGVTE